MAGVTFRNDHFFLFEGGLFRVRFFSNRSSLRLDHRGLFLLQFIGRLHLFNFIMQLVFLFEF
jgi:hypothetical protein